MADKTVDVSADKLSADERTMLVDALTLKYKSIERAEKHELDEDVREVRRKQLARVNALRVKLLNAQLAL